MATTYNNLYLDTRARLRKAGVDNAQLEARELICAAAGKTAEELYRDISLYTTDEIAVRIAERIIRKVNESAGATIGQPVHISIGLASKQPDDTVRDLYQRADEALYTAKHKGKNACHVYSHTF